MIKTVDLLSVVKFLILTSSSPVASQVIGTISRKFNVNLHPVDFNRKFFDSRPLLGKGKTIEGSIGGIAAPVILSLFLAIDCCLAFLLGIGAVLGDIFESFVKRRLGKERGEDWYPWDSIDFYVGAVIISQLWNYIKITEIIVIGIILIVVHPIMTKIAKILKVK